MVQGTTNPSEGVRQKAFSSWQDRMQRKISFSTILRLEVSTSALKGFVFHFISRSFKKTFWLNVECLKALHEVFMYLMILMAQKKKKYCRSSRRAKIIGEEIAALMSSV